MATVSIYLNFVDQTEAAFTFYKQVFGNDFDGDGISRMGDVPPSEDLPALSDQEKNLVMHVSLETVGGVRIMGSDVPTAMGQVTQGNNVYINLQPDTTEEADRLFAALSEGGEAEMPMQKMFWGDYFGSLRDKFGICWMINVTLS